MSLQLPEGGPFSDAPGSATSVPALSVLDRLGFQPRRLAGGPGHSFYFQGLKIQALQCLSPRSFQDVILFTGMFEDHRTLRRIMFETPTVFESFEQGVAWVADGISRRIPASFYVDWIDQGRAWRGHLPWVRRQAAYDARPHCRIDREWFKLAAARLREWLMDADPTAPAVFAFDGQMLTIHGPSGTLPLPAEGIPWSRAYSIRLGALRGLPKRLMHHQVEIGIWEGCLSIDRVALPLLPAEPEGVG